MRLLATTLALAASLSAQIHVDDDAPNDPGPNDPTISDPLEDGSSAHPFDSIQEAINATTGITVPIFLEPGRYAGPGNRGIVTGKSFRLSGRRGADETIIDLENAANFLTSSGTIQLDGLKVINGSGVNAGAFENTSAFAEVWILHCIFVNNHATGSGAAGGALTIRGTLECNNNAFLLNTTTGNGGAIAIAGNSTSAEDHAIVQCTLRQNRADGDGGGVWFDGTSTAPIVRTVWDSILWNNVAVAGSGSQIGEATAGSALVANCIVDGGWSGPGGSLLTSDPQFPYLRDFHLGLNSPARGLAGGLLCTIDPIDADAQNRNCGVGSTDLGADDYQPITFTSGPAGPGAPLIVRVAGAAAAQTVTLVVGFTLADPPIQTSFGLLEVQDSNPLFFSMPATDGNGVSTLQASLAGLPSGLDIVLQALVGSQLANGTTFQVP
ncbi:MAG: hypothetical protein KDE27_27605 [Planctomycetes bacterium]|nr:hypothetical protein [Planctomycetota bacterium]